jgi:SAM-dependent methyltransferase
MSLFHGDPSASMPEPERLALEARIAAALPRGAIHHGNREYWAARYAASAERDDGGGGSGDWVCSYMQVAEALAAELPAGSTRLLHIGCGDSAFARDMHLAGYTDALHTDVDNGVIEQQRKRSPELRWAALDACDMAGQATGSFDAVVDKGCLDIFLPLLIGAATTRPEEATMLRNAGRMLSEVSRVLRPGGVYVCISLHVHSALVLRSCAGMRHVVRFGVDGFAKAHAVDLDSGRALLDELQSALHSGEAGADGKETRRAPALLHICTKPPHMTALHTLPPMWSLDDYRDACDVLDRNILAQKRPEVAAVLLGLGGWATLRWLGRDVEAALLICALAVGYGLRVYLRTAFRIDAVCSGYRMWLQNK